MAVDFALPELKKLVDALRLLFGRFRVGAALHKSKTCVLFRATDEQTGEPIALKIKGKTSSNAKRPVASSSTWTPNSSWG